MMRLIHVVLLLLLLRLLIGSTHPTEGAVLGAGQ
jgi:hypothetical protein